MLAIARKEGQSILFPGLNIRICIHDISGRNVKLYIDAPNHIRVIRDELIGSEIASRPAGQPKPTHARPESEGGSDTPQNPPSLPAVNTSIPSNIPPAVTIPEAQPVQLWNKIQSRKSNKQTGDTTNG